MQHSHHTSCGIAALSSSAALAALAAGNHLRSTETVVTKTRFGHSEDPIISDTRRAGTVDHQHVHHHSTVIDRDTTVLSTDQVHTANMHHDATGTTTLSGYGSGKHHVDQHHDDLFGLRALLNDTGIAYADAQHDGLFPDGGEQLPEFDHVGAEHVFN